MDIESCESGSDLGGMPPSSAESFASSVIVRAYTQQRCVHKNQDDIYSSRKRMLKQNTWYLAKVEAGSKQKTELCLSENPLNTSKMSKPHDAKRQKSDSAVDGTGVNRNEIYLRSTLSLEKIMLKLPGRSWQRPSQGDNQHFVGWFEP